MRFMSLAMGADYLGAYILPMSFYFLNNCIHTRQCKARCSSKPYSYASY